MHFFKLNIIERVPIESLDFDRQITFHHDTLDWHKFEYNFNMLEKSINNFQGIVLMSDKSIFDSVRVEFNDGSYVYLTCNIDTFKIKILPKYLTTLEALASNIQDSQLNIQ